MFILALDKTMKYNDVFKKSDLGREEVKYRTLGILPREARTLLIMVDGKRSYQSYLETLDDDKMFVEFGGVTPLFELLLELDYIKVIGQEGFESTAELQPTTEISGAEFYKTFNGSEVGVTTKGYSATSVVDTSSYESTKSELAAYIETNAPAEEAWGHLLNLEQCDDPAQLLALVQQIEKYSNDTLSAGMNDFSRRIVPHIQ